MSPIGAGLFSEEYLQSMRDYETPEGTAFRKEREAEEKWRPGYDTLLRQMGTLQSSTDVYKRASPLSADTHMQNIAKSLAKDYGINSIGDIGVRQVEGQIYHPPAQIEVQEGNPILTDAYYEPTGELVNEYYNKNDPTKIIPGYKFASENRGDGYSNYNLQPIPDGKGGTIVLPIQQYSKSGWGEFAQDIGPLIPLVNAALLLSGIPPLTVAAGNVAFQAGAGNINNIGDVLKTAAPVLVGDPGVLGGAAKVYMAYNAFDKGQVLSGLASLAGAAGMNGLANDIRFVDAVKNGNVPGALMSLGNMANIPLKDDEGNILKDADGVPQTVGNIKIGGEDGLLLKEVVKGAAITANLLSDKPNYGLAIQMAGDLAGSKDTIIAGKAASLIQALNSGNPSAINNAVLSLAGPFNNKAPGSVPIENRTANDAVAAAAPDTSAAVNQTLANTDPVTNLAATDLVTKDASGNQLTPEQVAALNVANNNGLLATDLGTGAKLDTVNVAGTNTTIGNVNDDTITAGDIKLTSPISQLTANQIAALTSGNLTSLTSKSTNTLSPVTVTGKSSEAIGLNNDTLTDIGTKTTSSLTSLTSAQVAALTSGQVAAIDTKNTNTLAPVTVTAQSDAIGANDDTLTDVEVKTRGGGKLIVSLTSAQIAALNTKDVRSLDTVTITGKADLIGVNDDTITDKDIKTTSSLTTLPTDKITTLSTDKVTTLPTDKVTTLSTDKVTTLPSSQITTLPPSQITTLPPSQITTLSSNQIATGTSGSTALTSDQISALTTTPALGLRALPTSDSRYWRQTGATGTGGQGGVRFFDWYDTPENRTMAPPAMTTATFGALTSQQAGTIAAPTAKRYFNAATNQYYTDPTGTWQPPAGWAQTGLKGGGEVKTKHFDGEDGSYVGWDDSFSPVDPGILDYDTGAFDNPGTALGDFNYEEDTLTPAQREDLNNARWESGYFGTEEDIAKNYGNEGRAYSGENAIDPVTGSPINAKVGVPNKQLNSNPFRTLADAAKNNPDIMKLLLGAGLGGLLGYMGRPKGIKGRGIQGGGLGLSQSQVHGALKGVPVQRAEGGEIGGYAGGGGLHYLKSAEDGMADKIPATIDNKQPAKLSGGEFVIPADVVSHLGNGNSEAGAKQLYDMMDRIRHARTGNKQQGKQINPAKFTPK
jgi:hypothetical protein